MFSYSYHINLCYLDYFFNSFIKVPAEISHADFWKRYFYKVHQLQQDEARKLALMKRAEQAQKKEDSISWEGIGKLIKNCINRNLSICD